MEDKLGSSGRKPPDANLPLPRGIDFALYEQATGLARITSRPPLRDSAGISPDFAALYDVSL